MSGKIKVTIATEDGEVLDQLTIRTDYLQGIAVHPAIMAAQAVREAIEESFEVEED